VVDVPRILDGLNEIRIVTGSRWPTVILIATISQTSEEIWRIALSIDHWLPSLSTPSVGGSTRGSPEFTAPDFTLVVRDFRTSTTNGNINIEHRSMVARRELSFPGSRSLFVYSLWLVRQAV